ncbi:MAG: hypothetical protein JWP97_3926 [Labilithrix sp.]|nr:hypothetical protein [Labilithrix sp.]
MNIVVLGAGYAGLTAALRLARRARGLAQVTLVSEGEHFVDRIRLHERAAGRLLPARPLRSIVGDRVRVVPARATHVDRAARSVRCADGSTLTYDRLVLALGSRTEMATPGAAEYALALDAVGSEALASLLPALAGRRGRLVLVGGGLTGIEAATEIAESWPSLRVVLVTRGELGEGFSGPGTAHLRRVLERLGVEILTHTTVTHVERGRVVTAGELPVAFDACVWAAGFVGAPLPDGLDLASTARGQVLVEPTLRASSDPQVFVAGDLASHAVAPPVPVPTGCKSAAASGALVADNVLRDLRGEPLVPQDYAAPLYCVSLGRRDGLVQRTSAGGALRGATLTGWAAAFVKALILRSTRWQIVLERHGLATYRVFEGGNAARLAAAPASGVNAPRLSSDARA